MICPRAFLLIALATHNDIGFLPQSELFVFWLKTLHSMYVFEDSMMDNGFYVANRRHSKIYPRIIIPDQLRHFYQMAIHQSIL